MKERTIIEQGCLDIWIDEIVPCLKEAETGKELETAVFKIESRSYLKRYNSKTGWKINWSKVPSNVDVYALVLSDTNEIQGLVGIRNDIDADAIYIHWACTAPHNNKHDFGEQRYVGVGGHLFAIAAEKSFEYGHEGYVYGFASNQRLVDHYCSSGIGAKHQPLLHQYQIVIETAEAKKLLEVYTYDWADSKV